MAFEALPLRPPIEPMEASSAAEVPTGNWMYEPKWDGFRCIAFRDGDAIAMQSKSGQPLERYFPEMARAMRSLKAGRFILDGELVVPAGERFDFDQLLQRIHPAESRVRQLATQFPATYIVFDMLADENGAATYDLPFEQRRVLLETFAEKHLGASGERFRLSSATHDRSIVAAWYEQARGAVDGIVAKRKGIAYAFGDRKGMIKVKALRTADCVIAGYRQSGDAIGSLLLGLYDGDGKLDYVGFTSGFTAEQKRTLYGRLRALATEHSFTGRSPGGPSRWNRGKSSEWVPVEPQLVLEVQFDHVTNGRFRHGTKPLRFRPDKTPNQCTTEQLR